MLEFFFVLSLDTFACMISGATMCVKLKHLRDRFASAVSRGVYSGFVSFSFAFKKERGQWEIDKEKRSA